MIKILRNKNKIKNKENLYREKKMEVNKEIIQNLINNNTEIKNSNNNI
tara:strand:+ start:307 stop:450 length:144 start_codon:yes stop_codon:yes gene_type:complete